MKAKQITVKDATLKISTGYLPHIGKYKSGTILVSDLPKRVDILDPHTQQIHECNLIEIVTFQHQIPTVLSLLAVGKHPEHCLDDLLDLNRVNNVNQLAFYLYEPARPSH